MHSLNKCIGLAIIFLCCVQYGSSIKCYQCNSKDNPNCADPFDASSSSLIAVDCKHYLPNENSTFCRKTTHKVNLHGEIDERVIRACGFVEERRFGADEDADDDEENQGYYRCYMKPGTFGVETKYCACEEDNCNGVEKINIGQTTIAIMSVCAFVFSSVFL